MSHKARQLKSGILYLIATLIESTMPFITLPIFTRILSVEDYGALALAQVYAVIVAGIASFGLNTAYNRNYFEYYEDRQKSGELFFTTIIFVSVLSLLGGIATFVWQDSLSHFFIRSTNHGPLLFWSYVGICLVNLRLFFLIYLRNTDRPKQYVANTIFLSFFNFALSLYLVSVLRLGVMGVALGQVISATVVLVFLMMQFRKELPLGWNRKLLTRQLKIGGPTVPMVFFSFLNNHFDKYMIGLLTTIGGVGIYSVGQKVATVIFTFTTSLQNVFSPRVYQKMFDGRESSREEIGRYLLPFEYVIVFLALLIALFSEEIIWLFVPKQFYPAIDIIIILSLFYVVLFFAKVNADQIVFAKKTLLITLLVVSAGVLNVTLNIPFIHLWGAMGAASATFLSRALVGIIIFRIAQRYYRIHWPAREMMMIFGIFLFSALILLFMRHFDVLYPLRLCFKILVFIGYFYAGYKCHLLTKENFEILLSLIVPQANSASQSQKNGGLH